MNIRRTLLILAVLGTVVAALLFTLPRQAEPAASRPGTPAGSAGRPVASGSPAPGETAEVPGGWDGTFATAPVRAADALIDPQPADAPRAAGEKMSAWVTLGTRVTPELHANQLGEFPRAYVEPGQEVTVRVRFPDAEPGSRVAAQVEDGGQFADGKPVVALDLDANREASFRFQAGKEQGRYRISVRHGPEWKTVQVWASTDPELAINR